MSTEFNTPDDYAAIDDHPVGILMPYGKHEGEPISEVPLQYLAYIYANHNFTIYPELQRAIETRLGLPHGPTRTGPATQPQPPAQQPPFGAKVGCTNGTRPGKPETGLDGFRKALDRVRRESLLEYQDEPEISELLEDVFARVQRALGI